MAILYERMLNDSYFWPFNYLRMKNNLKQPHEKEGFDFFFFPVMTSHWRAVEKTYGVLVDHTESKIINLTCGDKP